MATNECNQTCAGCLGAASAQRCLSAPEIELAACKTLENKQPPTQSLRGRLLAVALASIVKQAGSGRHKYQTTCARDVITSSHPFKRSNNQESIRPQ